GRERVARDLDLHVREVEHLISRHGSRIQELARMMRERPELREPIPGAEPYLMVEALYATSHEGALHLDDVLTRRTRISIETFDRGIEAAPHVAELMAEVLGWDEETKAREITHYEARVAAERDSQAQPDDHTADAARLGAPDVRRGGVGAADVVDLDARRS
ncbi:MAG: glycerol-3-phosphate dehydrogenase, partial [Actinomycetota bacterium]|nr:glycerol-3-phosphate dehydrogenase [Actinomycetota bacterium]